MNASVEARPDVSVVIPTRDRREMLLRAIRSCLGQENRPAIEVIVVDDGCTDGSVGAVRERYPEVLVLTGRQVGNRNEARNEGLARASGRYVKFLDDDDWLEPGALAEEVRLADASAADIVAGGHRTSGLDIREEVHLPPAFDRGLDSLLAGEAVPTGAALYRRESILALRWDMDSHKLDDWQFFLKAALAARVVVPLDRVVYTWFAHPGQGTRRESLSRNADSFYRVLDELQSLLAARGELTLPRRLRLAQYRYKELRVLCVYDRKAFEAEVLRIRALDPEFRPVDEERQIWMRRLAAILGFRRALLLHTFVKRLVKGRPEVAG